MRNLDQELVKSQTTMIKDLGCKFSLIGHSERRIFSHESNKKISKKLNPANKNSVMPVLCVGEFC